MTNIYLARHGQNVDNANGILNGHRDEPLTEIGVAQAEEVAQKIKSAELEVGKILCSPLVRASKTAEIIAKAIDGPEPVVEDLLIERDFGAMTGVEQSRVEELCAPDILKTETVTYFLNPDDAETFPDLIHRAGMLLDKLSGSDNGEDVLLVSHGDIGKMIYAKYYDQSWDDVLRQFHFGNSELLILSEDSDAQHAHVFTIDQHNS